MGLTGRSRTHARSATCALAIHVDNPAMRFTLSLHYVALYYLVCSSSFLKSPPHLTKLPTPIRTFTYPQLYPPLSSNRRDSISTSGILRRLNQNGSSVYSYQADVSIRLVYDLTSMPFPSFYHHLSLKSDEQS
jgi:hypothetical protein